MAKISKIEAQKRKGRYNIYLDGKYAFPVAESVLIQFRLMKGTELDEKQIAAVALSRLAAAIPAVVPVISVISVISVMTAAAILSALMSLFLPIMLLPPVIRLAAAMLCLPLLLLGAILLWLLALLLSLLGLRLWLRPALLLLLLPQRLPSRLHQDGQDPEPVPQPHQDLRHLRPADVLPEI